jgi:hypothetical protein
LDEFVDVLLGEVEFVVVEQLEIGREEFRGHGVVEFFAAVVGLLEPVGDGQRDAAFVLGIRGGCENRRDP